MIEMKSLAVTAAFMAGAMLVVQGDILYGANYCTYTPDTACYLTGHPTCCGGNMTCPVEQPTCELGNVTNFGGHYCFYSPDPDCYVAGVPICCEISEINGTEVKCPNQPPSCEIESPADGAEYCTYAPDADCYISGWPTCCGGTSNINATCPEEKPSCEMGTPTSFGGAYCFNTPDDDCFVEGIPICCALREDGTKCPSEQPSCEIEVDIEVEVI